MLAASSKSVATRSMPQRPIGVVLGRPAINWTLPFKAVGWIAAAVDFIIAKPINLDELADAVARLGAGQ